MEWLSIDWGDKANGMVILLPTTNSAFWTIFILVIGIINKLITELELGVFVNTAGAACHASGHVG